MLFFPSRVRVGRRIQLYTGSALTADLTGLAAMLSVLAFAAFKAATSRSLVSKAAQLPTIANVERGRQPQVNGGQNGGKHAMHGLPELGGNASAESG